MDPGLSGLFRIVNFPLNFSNIVRSEGDGGGRHARLGGLCLSIERDYVIFLQTQGTCTGLQYPPILGLWISIPKTAFPIYFSNRSTQDWTGEPEKENLISAKQQT